MQRLLILLIVLVVLIGGFVWFRTRGPETAVVVGSKQFTEQRILGEMIAQLIEAKTGLAVQRRLGLQGTKICFGALREGDLDLYPEYTGTGLINLLERTYDPSQSRQDILTLVRKEFDERWNLNWYNTLGFANTYAYAVREAYAQEHDLTRISDLERVKDTIRPGFDHEYSTRPEFKRFDKAYGFTFGTKITKLDPDVTYRALKDEDVDLIDAFSTDGRIAAYDLRTLEDDKHLFPPYDVGIVVRQETLDQYPELKDVFDLLTDAISAKEMRKMNYAVTDQLQSPRKVARDFLVERGLMKGDS